MEFFLHPMDKNETVARYNQAIVDAVELFIVNAYLTDWQPKHQITSKCQHLLFIVGTDFGLTRKNACGSVLKWLPEEHKCDFLAADRIDGFHPKLVLWKDAAEQGHLLLGSSNLTKAAFSTNYEANVYLTVSTEDYHKIREWVYKIRLECSPISKDWLRHYAEQKGSHTSGMKPPVVSLQLPSGPLIDKAILTGRNKHEAFAKAKESLADLIEKCANETVSKEQFYEQMMALWGRSEFRLQGKGFERQGKQGNWQEVCKSISAIRSSAAAASLAELDNRVRKEIDRLSKEENPNRGAWLSEMLCHYYPSWYPLLNEPIRVWLRYNKYRAPSRASEGASYIDLALKLRKAIEQNRENKAKNLLELDQAIWKWYDLKRAKKRQ